MNTAVDLVIANAGELLTCAGPATGVSGAALASLPVTLNGAVAVHEGCVAATGTTEEILSRFSPGELVDAGGRLVSPALVDPHTHLVHMGSREDELEARATGSSATKGISTGGIRTTIEQTSMADDKTLTGHALHTLDQMVLNGTGTVEAKTGYGADMDQELRLLKLTRDLDALHPVEVVPTFLGAHIPPREGREAFVQSVIDALPQAAQMAEFCDIACDAVCFTFEESDRIAEAATRLGMRLRIHANQASHWPGLKLAAKWNAASADHGDYATREDLEAMAAAGVALTLLPGANFHMLEAVSTLDGDTIGPAAKDHLPQTGQLLLQSGCVPAVGTNYNPGSSPCLSMQMMMQLLPRIFRIGFAPAWYMATLNAAATLGRGDRIGSLEPGKEANLIVWDVERHGQVIDRFGGNHVRDLWLKGRQVVSNRNLSD